MRTWGMYRVGSLAAIVLALSASGCGAEDAENQVGSIAISASAVQLADGHGRDVHTIELTVEGVAHGSTPAPDFAKTTQEMIQNGANSWSARWDRIPVGYYQVSAVAKDGAGEVLYVSRELVPPHLVEGGLSTTLNLLLHAVGEGQQFGNRAPQFDGVSFSATQIEPDGSIHITIRASDLDDDSLTVRAFSRWCKEPPVKGEWPCERPTGRFIPGAWPVAVVDGSATLTWYPGETATSEVIQGLHQIHVSLTDGFATSTMTFHAWVGPKRGSFDATFEFNNAPDVRKITVSPANPLEMDEADPYWEPNAHAHLVVDAVDDGGVANLTYHWSIGGDCVGKFRDYISTHSATLTTTRRDPYFHLETRGSSDYCRLNLVVEDGWGLKTTSWVEINVMEHFLATYSPNLVATFQSSMEIGTNGSVRFQVKAPDLERIQTTPPAFHWLVGSEDWDDATVDQDADYTSDYTLVGTALDCGGVKGSKFVRVSVKARVPGAEFGAPVDFVVNVPAAHEDGVCNP